MKNLLTTKTTASLFFACVFCWVAAASIERSMFFSGQSKEHSQGARRAKLDEQIEKQKSEITALMSGETSAASLNEAQKREDLAYTLWQAQKFQEAGEQLLKAIALERNSGAGKEKIISTLNKIAAVHRDNNNNLEMHKALSEIEKLDESDPSAAKEVLIKDKQDIATSLFLSGLASANADRRRTQLVDTQKIFENLKQELLNNRRIESLNAKEKALLAVNDENQSAIFDELGNLAAAKSLKDEAQTIRSALRSLSSGNSF